MIIIKTNANFEAQTSKMHRNLTPKVTGHQIFTLYEFSLPYQEAKNNKTQMLKTLLTSTPAEDQDVSKPTIKLPLISKKRSETPLQDNDLIEKREENSQIEEIKAILADSYLKKYVDRKSSEKIKSESNCNFLSIVGVKPGFKSSSRMNTKDVNNLLLVQKLEKPDKLLPLKENENNKIEDQSQSLQVEDKRKWRRNFIKYKSSTAKKTGSMSRPKMRVNQLSSGDKKKPILLRIQKPKQSPNYFEWCLFIGILDGIVSQKQANTTYKAFVGKGNNSILVKNIIKSRPWWILCQQDTQANLSWTQSRDPKFLQTLKQGPQNSQIQWNNALKAKFQIFGNIEWGLSDKTKDCIGLGFHKVLSHSQQQILCKSNTSVQLYYPKEIKTLQALKLRSHNHLQFNWNLSNKKALYYNMKAYYLATSKDPFQHIPQTYHVQKEGDDQWNNFLKGYENKGLWIIKPGENSNRGCGINVVETLDQVREIVRNKSVRENGKPRSHIIQRYLMPYLYNKRKFDMRCYMLVTSVNGNLRCYWYEEGYVRTASKEFTIKNLKNRMIHLTNDAVQKHSQTYGKHQSGNKLSFLDFHKYVKNTDPNFDFFQHSYPKMVQLAADAIRSTYLVIDAKHRQFSFQIFGLDFMIDKNFKTWLIEVNTNPCLQLSCPLLARIIPSMLENAFRIAIDPLYPPPKDFPKHKGLLEQLFQGNKFSLVFSGRQEQQLTKVLQPSRLQDIGQSEQQSACEDEQ